MIDHSVFQGMHAKLGRMRSKPTPIQQHSSLKSYVPLNQSVQHTFLSENKNSAKKNLRRNSPFKLQKLGGTPKKFLHSDNFLTQIPHTLRYCLPWYWTWSSYTNNGGTKDIGLVYSSLCLTKLRKYRKKSSHPTRATANTVALSDNVWPVRLKNLQRSFIPARRPEMRVGWGVAMESRSASNKVMGKVETLSSQEADVHAGCTLHVHLRTPNLVRWTGNLLGA